MIFLDQSVWTLKFIEAAGRPSDGLIVERLRKTWWFNPLNNKSMRLSKEGANFAKIHAKIHHYTHDLDQIILPRTLLQLEKFFKYPYYIPQIQKIVVFDESTSLTLTLYNNNLQTYLDNIQKFN